MNETRDSEAVTAVDGKLAEIEVVAQQVLAMQADNADAHHALGLIRMRQARWSEAAGLLQWAHDAEPERPEFTRNFLYALNGLAKSETDRGAYGEARAALQTALNCEPGDTDLLLRMSFVLSRMGRAHEALAAAQLATKGEPDLAEPQDKAGLAYLAMGRTALALKSFEDALSKDPGYAPAHVNLGNTR